MPPPQQARQSPPASKPPIPSDFKSPWIDKTAEACAAFLHAMPREENAYAEPVNRFLFTALTEFSKEDDTVLMCRVVLEHEEDESREDRNMPAKNEDGSIKVEFFPVATERVQMSMWTNDRLKFAEKMGNYQKSRMAKGEPDRSQGKRYW
ncbi:hypothetical protein EJ02DRAFT_439666 [Clathrospora elynae]|uniref:Uncharacterized protein n=1 Tax=Clathrospora elynae TaxID=706981 RepID=A0A6A5S576_9PLEO|nr:hypothetical protein EJ02DRAFT_439666 [Clathrospora elynae]